MKNVSALCPAEQSTSSTDAQAYLPPILRLSSLRCIPNALSKPASPSLVVHPPTRAWWRTSIISLISWLSHRYYVLRLNRIALPLLSDCFYLVKCNIRHMDHISLTCSTIKDIGSTFEIICSS